MFKKIEKRPNKFNLLALIHLKKTLMSNPVLRYMQSLVGKKNADTPSGLGRWLMGEVVAVEDRQLIMNFEVRQDMTNPTGMLHGGAISAIMDEMIGALVMCMGKSTYYTSVNLQVDFFAPAKVGDQLQATAYIVKEGRQIVHAGCDLQLIKKKRLLARASSNLMRTEIPVEIDDKFIVD